ncbi:hypothetical protein KR074_010738, partial [Drosophila pseudoananassae]
LMELINLEQKFIKNLKAYTEKLNEKVNNLQAFIESVDYGVNQSLEEREKYLSNPLNAFSLMRRTHEDLPKWHNYTKQVIGLEELYTMDEIMAQSPDETEMKDALQGMNRLEEIYNLEAIDLAKGHLLDKKHNIQLSIRDCVALGNDKFKKKDYPRASMWFRVAIKHEPEIHSNIINYILGDPMDKLHLKYAKAILVYAIMKSNPKQSLENAEETADEAMTSASLSDLKSLITEVLSHSDQSIISEMAENKTAPTDYELGCRGLFPLRKDLFCRYNFYTTPFLRIAPLKQEILSLDPLISMFHEVLPKNHLLDLEQNLNITTQSKKYKRRITKIFSQRITDITGLHFSKRDQINIYNYGLENQAEIHYNSKNLRGPVGAILFFISDDIQGGATVFPKLKVSVFPKKGSSLVWYDIKDDGNLDPRTTHSICPVLEGN